MCQDTFSTASMKNIKHEWRKKEKALYLPKAKPEVINVPEFSFICLKGQGNPNGDFFTECIGALYSLAYAIKMTLKKLDKPPSKYQDYTVYPLEGVWDITEEAKKNYKGVLNKDDLVFEMMLRQPDFVSNSFFEEMLEHVKLKKPQTQLKNVKFKRIKEGKCIQMMHIGSYDDEPASFKIMEEYAHELGLQRKSKIHKEIYISDFRKVAPEKLKTVLRFNV